MGRGDQKTKKGKRARGSYGNTRLKKSSSNTVLNTKGPKKETSINKPVEKKIVEPKKATAKKSVKKEKDN